MQKGVIYKSVRVIIVIALALLVAVSLVALRPKAKRQLPPKTGRLVEVISVQPRTVTMPIKAFGTIAPREKLLLVAEVGGEIVQIDTGFAEGNCVNQDAVLAAIDPVPYTLEVERSQGQVESVAARIAKLEQEVKNLNANLAIAREDMQLAQDEFRRLEDLFASSVSSKSNRDRAKQGYLARRVNFQAIENQLALTDALKAGLLSEKKIARAALGQVRYNLERSKITAPFAGWVLEKKIEIGQHVNTGQYLGSIYRTGALDIEVAVPLNELRWLQDDTGTLSGYRVAIQTTGGAGNQQWSGRLARIMAGLDDKTRMQRFVIEIENGAETDGSCPGRTKLDRLRPGMFVEVEIQGKQIENIYMLPRYVVQTGDAVFLAAGDELEVRPVHVLRRQDETVYIDQGLTEQDLIIKTPLAGVTGGEKIRIKN